MHAISQIATISFLLPSLLCFSFLLPTFISCVSLTFFLSLFLPLSLSFTSICVTLLYRRGIVLSWGRCFLLVNQAHVALLLLCYGTHIRSSTTLHYTTLHYTTLHYPTLFCIALNRIVTLHTVNCCTEVLQRDVWWCTVQYCAVLYRFCSLIIIISFTSLFSLLSLSSSSDICLYLHHWNLVILINDWILLLTRQKEISVFSIFSNSTKML